jgi:hypothetical protein
LQFGGWKKRSAAATAAMVGVMLESRCPEILRMVGMGILLAVVDLELRSCPCFLLP